MAQREPAPPRPLQLGDISPHAEREYIVRRVLGNDILARINHPNEIYAGANRILAINVLILFHRNLPRAGLLIVVQQFLDRLYAHAWPQYLSRRIEQLTRENERLRNAQREATTDENNSDNSYSSI
eukprot:GHVU01152640.1.p1 GENE.GHVU01152640.1~~GHVU01152640.1.p1  ORF type:complete len:126 (+),score=1.24 GHVU01152640.1:436-813(+)